LLLIPALLWLSRRGKSGKAPFRPHRSRQRGPHGRPPPIHPPTTHRFKSSPVHSQLDRRQSFPERPSLVADGPMGLHAYVGGGERIKGITIDRRVNGLFVSRIIASPNTGMELRADRGCSPSRTNGTTPRTGTPLGLHQFTVMPLRRPPGLIHALRGRVARTLELGTIQCEVSVRQLRQFVPPICRQTEKFISPTFFKDERIMA